MSDKFTKLEFENGTDITQEQLTDALTRYKFVHVEMTNEQFSPNIYVPDELPLNGEVIDTVLIYVTNDADETSIVHLYGRAHAVASGERVTLLPNAIVKRWELVRSAK